MTSVKDFQVDDPATSDALGRGRFVFTDEYSVFDWGKMPDTIPKKGASLCTMGAYNFERLEAAGVPTHYRGVVAGDEVVSVDAVETPPTAMAIDLTQVPDLPYSDGTYDYDAYHDAAGENYLVPLEIVFRNVVPVGSSLRTRGVPADYGLDLEAWPDEPVPLEEPVVEFSTKYEEQDRYLDRAQADRIAGRADVADLESVAREVNRLVTERAEETGFVHQDGKIEVLYFDGEIRVADVVGTFDENRFGYDGQQVSKEVIRQYYRRADPEWVKAVGTAKAEAREAGVADWRTLVEVSPKPLPEHVIRATSNLYAAGPNAYLDRDLFDAPATDAAVDRVRTL
ncbi:MAG: phosphoribosylaminoimidazolesuccinocarboxamide synthase [Halanaeroarchaeum sp.]